jgi:TolA-binding protein
MNRSLILIMSLICLTIGFATMPILADDSIPSKLMIKASEKETAGQKSAARAIWSLIAKDYSSSPEAAQAQLKLACSFLKEDPKQANNTLDAIIKEHPNSSEAIDASLYRGQLLLNQDNRKEAKAVLETGYKTSKRLNQGALKGSGALCFIQLGNLMLDDAITSCNDLDKKTALKWLTDDASSLINDPVILSNADIIVAQYYLYQQQDSTKAKLILNHSLAACSNSVMAPVLKYELANISYNSGSYQTCINELQLLLANGINNKQVEAMGRYLIGDCYVRLGNKEAARATWTAMISSYPGTEYVEMCNKALEILDLSKREMQ